MNRFSTIVAASALLGLAAVANAQSGDTTTDFTPVNLSFRLGVGLPLDNALANYSNTLVGLGVDYSFDRPWFAGGDTFISLDYLTKNLTFSGGIFPLCVNQRFYFKNGRRSHRTYAFIGVGGAVLNLTTSATVVAARAGIGADLGDAIFAEMTGLITDKANDATGASVAFYVGYRF